MRETGFIRQNKDKWEEFEKVLSQSKKDPEQLSELFVQVTDDLSYSRTFYPNRSVRVYLNNVAQKVFHSIYKNKRGSRKGVLHFWKEELPRSMWEARKELLVAFLVFGVSMIIGIVSSINDPEFTRQILGDSYVEMTIANIEEGDPMKVYKDENAFEMFLRIAWNNISIALQMFVSGILFAIGTLASLIQNGVMVGSFQYFFVERGLFAESFLTIWMHGALEISIIVISGCAGLVMGSGLVFPGTYSRGQSFLLSARRGLNIMLGVVPLLALAAFIEGFLTRYTELPDFVKALEIALSFGFILFYFVVYPWRKARAGFKNVSHEERLPPTVNRKVRFTGIRSFGDSLTDMFSLYRRMFKTLIISGLTIATAYMLSCWYFLGEDIYYALYYWIGQTHQEFIDVFIGTLGSMVNILQIFDYEEYFLFFWLNLATMTLSGAGVLYIVDGISKGLRARQMMAPKAIGKYALTAIPKVGMVMLGINALIWWMGGWAVLFVPLVMPIAFNLMYVMIHERTWPHVAIPRTFKIMRKSWGNSYGMFFTNLLLSFLYFTITSSVVALSVILFLNLFLGVDNDARELLFPMFMGFSMSFGLWLVMPLWYIGQSMLYGTMVEVNEATELREQIATIGKKRKAYGLSRLE